MAACRRRRARSIHFSSATCEWSTPRELFDRLNAQHGPFDLDPCATSDNAQCVRFFTRADDGLSQPWTGRVFLNPPYGRDMGRWMAKALEASQTTAELVLCLVPARTDTKWWHRFAMHGEIEFLSGRVRFGGCPNSAPFPSAVVVFRNKKMLRNTDAPLLAVSSPGWDLAAADAVEGKRDEGKPKG
jgi:phage N-6-adenine-methyltransferase